MWFRVDIYSFLLSVKVTHAMDSFNFNKTKRFIYNTNLGKFLFVECIGKKYKFRCIVSI